MDHQESKEVQEELPDSWWIKVYVAVVVTMILVISLLGYFSYHFSS